MSGQNGVFESSGQLLWCTIVVGAVVCATLLQLECLARIFNGVSVTGMLTGFQSRMMQLSGARLPGPDKLL